MGTSSGRVAEHTAFDINQRITQDFHRSVAYYARHPNEIPHRLKELDREWDVERALALTSSCLSLFGVGLGFRRSRRWFALPALVQGFYLQHTLQGWCPPLPFFRRYGFRTPAEIDREKAALKELLRDINAEATGDSGDFEEDFEIVVEQPWP